MRSSFLMLLAVFFVLPAFSQTAKWDSTYRPGLFQYKIDQFKSYHDSTTDIIFLGNSITARTDWNELLGNPFARNRGISGDISFGVLQRLQEVTEGKPSKIFILVGINDISRNIPDSFIVDNYIKLIRKIKAASPATEIYLQTLLPVNNEFSQFKNHYNKDSHILWVNMRIKEIGQQEHIKVIDLYPHFLNDDKKLDKQLTEDGLHLNAAGYKRWAQILAPYVR